MMIDLRLLNAFVAVAETENVGRAAERLHISQSPLSRQVMQLERHLGLTLFERVRRRVRLTDEGHLLLVEARSLLAQAAEVETRAGQIARGERGRLTIGYVEAAMHSGILPSVLGILMATHPGVDLTLSPLRSGAQAEALRRRAIDVGLLYAPPDSGDVQVRQILDEPVQLALARAHPLGDRHRIEPEDLDGLAWIALPEAANPEARLRFLERCRACGFSPDIRMEADDLLMALRLVSAGLGATFVQSSLRDALPRRLIFRSVPWYPATVRLHAVWRCDDPKPLIAAFAQALDRAGAPARHADPSP